MRRASAIAASMLLMAIGASNRAQADQYRSEQRVIDTPSQATPSTSDPQKLLQTTTDPYAKALLLRDLAARAAQQKDYDKASRYLEQALAQNVLSEPAAAQIRNDLTQLYTARGDVKKVLPQLEAQLRSGQAGPTTMAVLASAYVDQKRYAEALSLLQKAGAEKPGADPTWRRTLAAAYIGTGRERDALPLLEQLLKEDPSHREDWLRLVALNLKAGNKPRAAALMELASRLGFLETSEQRLQLVTLTAQIGAPFEAGSLLQQWLQAKRVDTTLATQKLLASLWIAAREDSLAVPAIEAVLRSAPSAELYQQLAQIRLDREDYGGAAQALQHALELTGATAKTSGPLWLALGLARYQQADIEGSLQAFRQAATFNDAAKSAGEWIKYLETGKARDQALAATAQRQQRSEEALQLSNRIGGEESVVSLNASASGSAAPVAGSSALTPIGAQKDGNSDGSIPAWTGGLQRTQWPAAYKAGARLADPYPGDQPLFVITRDNLAQYRAHLSAGHLALFTKYPNYRMPVYTTRRSVGYPQAIYDASQANIGKARLIGSDSLENARLGFPFAQPKSGVEILWNHRTRYRGNSLQMQSTQAVVREGGAPTLLKQTERILAHYANILKPADLATDNILLYYLTWFGKSKGDIDFVALVHESTNSEKQPRNIWVIPSGVPKMFRVPPVGYDQPFPGADGLLFIDMVDMYNGAFDRYVWKLTGKRELYIPYNSYRLSDGRYRYAQLLQPQFFNPEGTRYELHRVWVIEATERGGARHSFGKRTFYVDEDSWNVVLVENEDHAGALWRFQEGHLLPAYNIQAANCAPVVVYDFKDGRYFVNRLLGEDPPTQFEAPMRDAEFVPDVVRARYGH